MSTGSIIGSLRADLSASIAKFQEDMGKAGDAVEKFAKRAKTVSRDLGRVGQELTLELTAPLVAFAVASAKAAAQVQDASGQVSAALASMGNRSGKSLEELRAQATALMHTSLFDDDDILRGVTANMLTFGNVSGDVFTRAQQAAVDMATRLKEDLQPATIQIGKALNDPIKGVAALAKVGVAFTQQQKDQIKTLVRSGRGYEAQTMILKELEKEFGGAGKAAADASPTASLIHSWDDLKESIGAIVLQYLPPLIKGLESLTKGFQSLSPATQKLVVLAAGLVALIGPLLVITATVLKAGVTIAEVFGSGGLIADAVAVIADVGAAMVALGGVLLGPIVLAIAGIVASLIAFKSVVAEWVAYVVGVFQQGLGQEIPKLLAAFQALWAQLSTGPIGEFFKVIGYFIAELVSGGLAILVAALLKVAEVTTRALTTVVTLVTDLVKVVKDVLSGDWAAAWKDSGQAVDDFSDGVLHTLDGIIPGVEAAAKALWQALTTWVVDGVKGILDWFSAAWAQVPDFVKAAAQGAAVWAKNLFDQIKTWLVDNLGPAVKWAMDRLADLAAFFGKISKQASAALNPPKPVVQPKPKVAPPPPKPTIAPVFNQGTDPKKAKDKIEQATKEYAKALQGLNDQIAKGLDEQELPKSIARADELRRKIDEVTETAKKAGVGVGKFAGQIALMRAQIDKLETQGLQKEADKFATDVSRETVAVNEFAKGGLDPLAAALQGVDDKYTSLKTAIQDQIDANAVLADHNATAAASMVVLKNDLADLEKAHTAATAAAKAQYAAEQQIANLQTAAANLDTSNQIRDLKQNSGQAGKFNTSQQDAVQAQEDALAKQRLASATQIAELQAKYDEAQRTGDVDSMTRLQSEIGLQKQLLDEVNSVTGAQLEAAAQEKAAWQQFTDQLADTLADVIVNWNGDLNSIRDVFKQLAKQLFLEPFLKGVGGALSGFMQGFGGAHAKGGLIRKGQWGIVGEKGPEPVYANTDLTVMPNDSMGSRGAGGSPTIVFNVSTPDANSFRKNARQLSRQAKQQLAYN